MKMFPVLWGYRVKDTLAEMQAAGSVYLPVCIPWDMLTPHAAQAQINHSQTLARLAERGGLSVSEAVAVLQDRRHRSMPLVDASETLCRLIARWFGEQPTAQRVVRHKKRGTLYTVIGTAELQMATDIPEGADLTIYRCDDGKWWARQEDEFEDGRFEDVPARPEDPTTA